MLVVLLLALYVLLNEGEGVVVKNYGKKYGSGGLFFNAIICLFSMVFFVVTDKGGLVFPKELLGYGLFSCLMFATGFYTMYMALKLGSFVASRLIASFSGTVSIICGIIILDEPFTASTPLAIALVVASILLRQLGGNKNGDEEQKDFSVKWLIMALLTAVSNGFIAVVSKMQQIKFDNAYNNEFMIMSFGGAFIILGLIGAVTERDNIKLVAKKGTVYGFLGGFFNGSKNFVNLLLQATMPISLLTPIKSTVGFIVSFFLSLFLYKEKFTVRQIISICVGVFAVVLLKVDIVQMVIDLF